MTPNFCVLLSYYNGGNYIEEQIRSIFNQINVNVHLIIRSDGSNIDNVNLLYKLKSKYKFDLIIEDNIGVYSSFMRLISLVNNKFNYYSLADQDDVWLPLKLYSAYMSIRDYHHIPALYSSNVAYVNENLDILSISDINYSHYNFKNLLVENYVIGCTAVFNNLACGIINSRIPQNALMHDWWIALIVKATGKIIFDNNYYILYRQHANNVIGQINRSPFYYYNLMKNFLYNFNCSKLRTSDQADILKDYYSHTIDNVFLNDINLFVSAKHSFFKRLHIFFSRSFSRNNFFDNIFYKFQILINKY